MTEAPNIGLSRRCASTPSSTFRFSRVEHAETVDDHKLLPLSVLALLIGVHVKTLAETCRQAVGDLQRLLSALPVDLLNWSDAAKRQGGRHP